MHPPKNEILTYIRIKTLGHPGGGGPKTEIARTLRSGPLYEGGEDRGRRLDGGPAGRRDGQERAGRGEGRRGREAAKRGYIRVYTHM